MIRWLILALAIYVLYKLVSNDFFRKKKVQEKEEKADTERKVQAGEMARDPECGTYVDIDSSISVRDGEKKYYFCSYDCRDKFLKRLESGSARLPETQEKEN